MKKKTLQAAVIALGILSASFTVSAMGETDVEDTVLSEITEESMQNQDVETEEDTEQENPDNPQPEKPQNGWVENENGWQYKDENGIC